MRQLIPYGLILALVGGPSALAATSRHDRAASENRFDLACDQEDYIDSSPYRPIRYHVDLGRKLVFIDDFPGEVPLTVTPSDLSYDRRSTTMGVTFHESFEVDRTTGSGQNRTVVMQGQSEQGMPSVFRIRCKKEEYSGPGGAPKF